MMLFQDPSDCCSLRFRQASCTDSLRPDWPPPGLISSRLYSCRFNCGTIAGRVNQHRLSCREASLAAAREAAQLDVAMQESAELFWAKGASASAQVNSGGSDLLKYGPLKPPLGWNNWLLMVVPAWPQADSSGMFYH